MGCVSSKIDDLPAVSLCRERCNFLEEAIRLRFDFAEAHESYLQSLKSVGISLERFFSHEIDVDSSSSPVLNLPSHRKGDSSPEKIHHLHSHSDSGGSHLNFESEDDEEEEDSEFESLHHHHREVNSPIQQQNNNPYGVGYNNMPNYDNFNFSGAGGGFMNMNYMKKQPTQSVLHTHRPMSRETMHMGDFQQAASSSPNSSSYYPYPNYQRNDFHTNYDPNYGPGSGYFNVGSSSNSNSNSNSNSAYPYDDVASSSKAPPPPPPPPPGASSFGWDFLNPFDNFERFYPTSSRDSREVREEEGIPELEDDENEVVKEVHGHQKYVDSGISSYEEEEDVRDAKVEFDSRQSVPVESGPVEYEVHVVDKKVVDSERGNNVKARGFKGDSEIVREIQVQFQRASECGNEIAKFLEVGKIPYKRKHGVTSKLLHLPVVSSSQSLTSRGGSETGNDLDVDPDVELRSRNLSSILHKLYLWEKKLYEEVKVEEKLRILHEKKTRKLKHMDERGAEAHKIESIRSLILSLSTKIRISIQVVDKISVKINTLRDEELWPQLNVFIQEFTRMWKSMLECHQHQCEAIVEAKRLDAIAIRNHFSESHFEATRQLEHDLINWTLRFSYWVGAQKGYVQALNNWLMKCLLYVPEETADGIVPFSPGRIGAPPVFVVCNQWAQLMDRVSGKEVIDSMREFASNVLQLWDRDKAEIRQRMLANKDERKVKSLDKEEQKIQKQIMALDKRMVIISAAYDNNNTSGGGGGGSAVYQSETKKGGSLQSSLQHVLEAMEAFTNNSLKVYDELLQRIEEDNLNREHDRVS